MIIYLLHHKDFSAIKIGMSDISGKRYAAHRSKGWKLVEYWHLDGDVRTIEAAVLSAVREKTKQTHFLTKKQMPQNGYTETFDDSKITYKQVKRIIRKAISQNQPAINPYRP